MTILHCMNMRRSMLKKKRAVKLNQVGSSLLARLRNRQFVNSSFSLSVTVHDSANLHMYQTMLVSFYVNRCIRSLRLSSLLILCNDYCKVRSPHRNVGATWQLQRKKLIPQRYANGEYGESDASRRYTSPFTKFS